MPSEPISDEMMAAERDEAAQFLQQLRKNILYNLPFRECMKKLFYMALLKKRMEQIGTPPSDTDILNTTPNMSYPEVLKQIEKERITYETATAFKTDETMLLMEHNAIENTLLKLITVYARGGYRNLLKGKSKDALRDELALTYANGTDLTKKEALMYAHNFISILQNEVDILKGKIRSR